MRDFSDRASLWLHIRATHKELAAFACGICLKICSDNEQLQKHVNAYHAGSRLLISEQRRLYSVFCLYIFQHNFKFIYSFFYIAICYKHS
jgi:Pyruvate/2-oxoacid:ferredoxin oxidoreductase delta subunit